VATDDPDHPPWCAPAECTAAGPTSFHPTLPPPAHAGRPFRCDPPTGQYGTGLTLQLVRFTDDPQPADFVRLDVGDSEGRQTHYIRIHQAQAAHTALTDILNQAGAEGAPPVGPERGRT
jgi:hypothetical protein